MFGLTTTGGGRTEDFIRKMLKGDLYSNLERYGQLGVAALARATPMDTGLTASAWGYRVIKGRRPGVEWYNTNKAGGTSVAILIQYGHGTGTGGYVQGRDYINPIVQPLFDQIADDVWKKVRNG